MQLTQPAASNSAIKINPTRRFFTIRVISVLPVEVAAL
jgi:hypothetical protein